MGVLPTFRARLSRSRVRLDPPLGPTPISLVDFPATGDLNGGNMVTLTLNLSSAM